jgi:starch phosphorylase
LADDWLQRHDDPEMWEAVDRIPAQQLWEVHRTLKRKLLRVVREKGRARWNDDGLSAGQLVAFGSLLDPDVLTIGFARRFATYKRGNLLLRDRERLRRILLDHDRPVQIVFAGKAHPADEAGKFVLQEVFQACMDPSFAGRLAFIEEYDKHIGILMVQGVDVWLNNPRPPQEASGTSGQKAAMNGVPNCSVLDGWWCEGYNQRNGWAVDATIGADDEATAQALYRLLEEQIVPLYYQRDSNDVPDGWVSLMKESIRSLAAPFSARRMLKEYVQTMYLAE